MKKLDFTITSKVVRTYEVELTDEQVQTIRKKMIETGETDEETLLEELFYNIIPDTTKLTFGEIDYSEDWQGEEWGEEDDYREGNEQPLEIIQSAISVIEKIQEEEEKYFNQQLEKEFGS